MSSFLKTAFKEVNAVTKENTTEITYLEMRGHNLGELVPVGI